MKGLLKVSFLAPKGLGGFVTNEELDEDEKGELFGILKKKRLLSCVVHPFDPLTNEFDRFNGLDYTQVLDLSQGFEIIFRKWSRGHREDTRKGLREGVTAEVASTEGDWKSYFAFYQESLSRWGNEATNRYGWKLFELMYKRKSPNIKLWLAKYNGQIIAGALCLYHNKHVAGWHMASSQEFNKRLHANHVLQYYIIKDACENGFLIFDFQPSSGIEGVIHWKSGFSPEKRPVHIYMSRSMLIASAMRRKLRNSVLYKILMRNTGF